MDGEFILKLRKRLREEVKDTEKPTNERSEILNYLDATNFLNTTYELHFRNHPELREEFVRLISLKLPTDLKSAASNDPPRTYEEFKLLVVLNSDTIRHAARIENEARSTKQQRTETPVGFVERLLSLRREFLFALEGERITNQGKLRRLDFFDAEVVKHAKKSFREKTICFIATHSPNVNSLSQLKRIVQDEELIDLDDAPDPEIIHEKSKNFHVSCVNHESTQDLESLKNILSVQASSFVAMKKILQEIKEAAMEVPNFNSRYQYSGAQEIDASEEFFSQPQDFQAVSQDNYPDHDQDDNMIQMPNAKFQYNEQNFNCNESENRANSNKWNQGDYIYNWGRNYDHDPLYYAPENQEYFHENICCDQEDFAPNRNQRSLGDNFQSCQKKRISGVNHLASSFPTENQKIRQGFKEEERKNQHKNEKEKEENKCEVITKKEESIAASQNLMFESSLTHKKIHENNVKIFDLIDFSEPPKQYEKKFSLQDTLEKNLEELKLSQAIIPEENLTVQSARSKREINFKSENSICKKEKQVKVPKIQESTCKETEVKTSENFKAPPFVHVDKNYEVDKKKIHPRTSEFYSS